MMFFTSKIWRLFNLSPTFCVRIYAGILSFVCAETLTASSLYWIINPIAYALAFPVYLTHILFFYSLAHHCGRRSIQDLYLFGILFALYESWVTKVIWSSYPGEDKPALGSFLGHSIHETIVLIFYVHAMISFIFPLVAMKNIFPALSKEIGLNNSFFGNKRIFFVLFWFSFTALAFLTPLKFENLAGPILHWGPTLLLVYAGYKFTKRQIEKNPEKPAKLELSKHGTIMMGGVILAMYISTYFLILPERIPSLWVQIGTLLIYAAIIGLIYFLKREDCYSEAGNTDITPRQIFGYLVLMTIVTTLIFFIKLIAPSLTFLAAVIGVLLMMVAGCILIWSWAIKDLINLFINNKQHHV